MIDADQTKQDNGHHSTLSNRKIMSKVEMFDPTALVFSDKAAKKVRELIEEEENPALSLRVYVTGGGCSGFQYGFSFDEEIAEDDAQIENNGVRLIVDPMSYPYLAGGVVDYTEGLEGSKFIVQNPNAEATCGCGASFSI